MIVLALLMPVVFWITSLLLASSCSIPCSTCAARRPSPKAPQPGRSPATAGGTGSVNAQAALPPCATGCARPSPTLKGQHLDRALRAAGLLAIVGKPSIVDVELGDNKRRNMTILFSDIRNFYDPVGGHDAGRELRLHQHLSRAHGPGDSNPHGFIDKYIGERSWRCSTRPTMPTKAGLGMLETAQGLQCRAPRGRPGADRHRRGHQYRHPDDGHDRREAHAWTARSSPTPSTSPRASRA